MVYGIRHFKIFIKIMSVTTSNRWNFLLNRRCKKFTEKYLYDLIIVRF